VLTDYREVCDQRRRMCALVGGIVIEFRYSVRRLQCSHKTERKMNIGIAHLQPIVSLIAGILILIMPQLLNYIVAIFLIVSGILGLGLLK